MNKTHDDETVTCQIKLARDGFLMPDNADLMFGSDVASMP